MPTPDGCRTLHARLSPADSQAYHSHVGPEAATLYHDLMLQQEPESAGTAATNIDLLVTEVLGLGRYCRPTRRGHVNTGERVHAARRRFLSAGLSVVVRETLTLPYLLPSC